MRVFFMDLLDSSDLGFAWPSDRYIGGYKGFVEVKSEPLQEIRSYSASKSENGAQHREVNTQSLTIYIDSLTYQPGT